MTRSSRQPRIEPLEDRTLMSTCHVTRLSDNGVGKGFRGDLRYCINKVNAEPGADVIDFTVSGTIHLNAALPDLASDIDIQGPGASLLTVRRTGGGGHPYYRIFTVLPGATVDLSGMTMANGNALLSLGGCGGGICNNGTLLVEDCVVIGNQHISAHDDFAPGGGVYNAGVMIIQRTVIAQNEALGVEGGTGGGVYNAATGDLTIIDSTITANYAGTYYGIGAGLANDGSVSIYNTTISENQTGGFLNVGYGGGLANYRGLMVIVNSTIAANNADFGSGIYTGSQADLTVISHSSISGNYPEYGIKCATASSLFVRNSIIANNSAGDNACQFTASGYNLIGNSSTGNGYAPSDILDVDPMLGPLADNGGPTLTMALLPGSPAIDAGDNTDAPEWDQRGLGFPRIVNGTIDIGAFEVQATGAPSAPNVWRGSPDLAVLLTAIFSSADEDLV